jgi:hypothetical protein
MTCLEHPAGAFEHGAGMGCVDREDVHGAAEQASERVGEHAHQVPDPIKTPKLRPRQCGGDRHPVEIADVVGRDHEGSRLGQCCSAGGAQPEQPAHEQPVERVERQGERRQQRAHRSEPKLEIGRHRRFFMRRREGSAAPLGCQARIV